jgi:catechol-2,3-dioxygenase
MIPALTGIDHVHVHVADRDAAEAWYASILGLVRVPDLVFWEADGGPLTIANASGTVHLALFARPAGTRHATIAFAANARELLAWQSHLTAALGHAIELEDHQVSWSLYFADPDGNPCEITSYEYAEVALALKTRA